MTADKVRLDKWLWAARFFKTRNLAKQAIEGGKVHYDGDRCKVSKEVAVGAELRIRQGWDEKTVEVLALSNVRGSANIAQQLYRETAASIALRELNASQRRANGQQRAHGEGRPTKKDRRLLQRFTDDHTSRE